MADQLQTIPGIGPSMAQDLRDLGIFEVSDLVGNDPELMYKRLCLMHGMHIDRCVLYVFRCAVYFATEKVHEPELLKWWNWQDRKVSAAS
jgi:pathogenicity locus Cdd1 protein